MLTPALFTYGIGSLPIFDRIECIRGYQNELADEVVFLAASIIRVVAEEGKRWTSSALNKSRKLSVSH
jgi:hypothetical protein